MKMDIFDLMYDLNDVSDYLVMESERRSPQIKERVIVKWSTIAASVCLVLAAVFFAWRVGVGPGHVTPGQTVGETDATNTETEFGTNDTETETNTVTEPETEMEMAPGGDYETVGYGGVVYDVYDSYAIVSGASSEEVAEVVIMDEVDGVPVTEIRDGAFDDIFPLRIYCDANYNIYEYAREYAIAHDHVFIETNSGKLPDHYYPDWVEDLKWQPRDTSGDEFIFVDDNARLTELAVAYAAGDADVYDELLQRLWYRYSCAMQVRYWDEIWPGKYEPTAGWNTDSIMTDGDRHVYYQFGDGNTLYSFAYGYIDTYSEYIDYFEKYFTTDTLEAYFENYGPTDIEGEVFRYRGYAGYTTGDKNPVFSIRVAGDTIVLTERREVWDDPYDQGGFTGEYTETEIVFEYRNGKWQLPFLWDIGYNDATFYYKEHYGSADPFSS